MYVVCKTLNTVIADCISYMSSPDGDCNRTDLTFSVRYRMKCIEIRMLLMSMCVVCWFFIHLIIGYHLQNIHTHTNSPKIIWIIFTFLAFFENDMEICRQTRSIAVSGSRVPLSPDINYCYLSYLAVEYKYVRSRFECWSLMQSYGVLLF